MFGSGGLASLLGRRNATEGEVELGDPFNIAPLLVFAGAYAAIALLNTWFSRHLGKSALLVTSSVSGLFDVDVAVLSAARLATTSTADIVPVGACGERRVASDCCNYRGFGDFSALYLFVTTIAVGGGLVAWSLAH